MSAYYFELSVSDLIWNQNDMFESKSGITCFVTERFIHSEHICIVMVNFEINKQGRKRILTGRFFKISISIYWQDILYTWNKEKETFSHIFR